MRLPTFYEQNLIPNWGLDLFHLPQMHAFNGMLTVIVQAGETAGNLELQVSAKGLKTARLVLPVQ